MMRMIMTASIDQAGRKVNHDAADGVSGRDRLLVQAAVSMLRLRDPRTAALRRWATGIAARRGKKIAVVALV